MARLHHQSPAYLLANVHADGRLPLVQRAFDQSLSLPPVGEVSVRVLWNECGYTLEACVADQSGDFPHFQIVVHVLGRRQGGEIAEATG
ncbi:MAG: hypothetical protein C0467_19665 [Planctomycetaceae bacterium]|nr:hypothetical protein [Planctomycetaceae bacterium]